MAAGRRNLFLLEVLCMSWPLLSRAEWDACTSIAIGRGATIEGSSIATHNNDCSTCDPRVAFIPARDYPENSRRAIAPFRLQYPRYVGVDRSEIYAPVDGQNLTIPVGFVDQVPHTYAYWEACYPLLNEHGLGFGESTCGAKLVGHSIMEGGEALFSLSELMQIGLERCKTARCAIETMGRYGVDYGFYGEDPGMPGAGESLSVVDPDETWVWHITGGLNNKSATWVAQRVPDNHVAVTANNFIIQHVDCKDVSNFMCSSNIFSNAREADLCDFATEAEFSWLNCYGFDVRYFHYTPTLPPIPYYTTLRMWRIQTLANPDVAPDLTDNAFSFPFSVPVLKQISRTDVMNWTRDYYKDTEFDMTQGVLAGPFGNPNRLEGGLGQRAVTGQFARGISIPRTNYALVVEAKPAPKMGQSIAWFATDQPLTSVFVPLIASADRAADAYQKGRQEAFTRDSAWWAFNFVSNWMTIDFAHMMRIHVAPAMKDEQTRIMEAVETLEAQWPEKKEAVNQAQMEMQEQLVKRWWTLADDLVVHFSDGVYTHKNNGSKASFGYPAWWLQMIGFNNEFFRVQWVQFSSFPPNLLLHSLPHALLRTHSAAANFLATAGFGEAAAPGTFLLGLLLGIALGGGIAALVFRKSANVSELTSHLLAQ